MPPRGQFTKQTSGGCADPRHEVVDRGDDQDGGGDGTREPARDRESAATVGPDACGYGVLDFLGFGHILNPGGELVQLVAELPQHAGVFASDAGGRPHLFFERVDFVAEAEEFGIVGQAAPGRRRRRPLSKCVGARPAHTVQASAAYTCALGHDGPY